MGLLLRQVEVLSPRRPSLCSLALASIMNDVRHPAAPLPCHTQQAIQDLFSQAASLNLHVCQACGLLQKAHRQASHQRLEPACLLLSPRRWDRVHVNRRQDQQTRQRAQGRRQSVPKMVTSYGTCSPVITSDEVRSSMCRRHHPTPKTRELRHSCVCNDEDRAPVDCLKSASAMVRSSAHLMFSSAKITLCPGLLWRSYSRSCAVVH